MLRASSDSACISCAAWATGSSCASAPEGACNAPANAAPKAGASPFASAGAAANPFGETKPAKAPVEDTRTAWEKLPKPAMAQVVIVLSFTTIISLMLATFWVVVQLGGVSFNDS